MKIFVTGATGFIGGHLCKRLVAAGHEVIALARPGSDTSQLPQDDRLTIAQGDVTVAASLSQPAADVDAVVHLAGTNHANKASSYYRVNEGGTRNVADAVPPSAHFVLVSALAAQGPSPAGQPVRAPGAEAPLGDYGQSKLAAERAILDRENTTILRPAITYGPRDPQLLSWCKMARRRIVPIINDLELSFLHVDDLCTFIAHRLDEGPSLGPWLLSDGEPVAMGRAVDLVESVLVDGRGARVPIPSGLFAKLAPYTNRLAKAAGVGHQSAQMIERLAATGWACDPALAQDRLGFSPQTPFAQGLRSTIEWYVDNGWL